MFFLSPPLANTSIRFFSLNAFMVCLTVLSLSMHLITLSTALNPEEDFSSFFERA